MGLNAYILLLITSVAAASARDCRDITVPIAISARNGVFSLKAPSTNIDVTNFILNSFQVGANYTAKVLQGVSES